MVETFYCQLDYEHVPYPSPSHPKDDVAESGCGVCAASMLVEGMLGVPFPIAECAAFSRRCGAREGYGTNFFILGGALAGRFGLRMRPTEDVDEAVRFLNAHPGGMAVANVRGDREGYIGVFSDCGHYVLLESARESELCVLDPMYRPGRYDIPGRAGKVRVNGVRAYADAEVFREDCLERSYFLFWKD